VLATWSATKPEHAHFKGAVNPKIIFFTEDSPEQMINNGRCRFSNGPLVSE